MSKRGYISRYMMLIKRLKGKPFSTFEDLELYVTRQLSNLHMQDDTLVMGFSKRTLQRDIKEIRTLFGIDITYDTSRKGYYINSSEYESSGFQRMIEAFDIFNSLNMTRDLSTIVSAEQRRPAGTDNMYGLLHAIKNSLQIKFLYRKFWNEEVRTRTVEPYLLKEFRNRWYVITLEPKGHVIKTFALDRISELEITSVKFNRNDKISIDDLFQHSFGIITGDGQPPEYIILSFDPFQGKYIKSLPLHTSQKVLIDNEDELRISLELHLTHDFLMEIRSFGEDVEVIEPASLKKNISESLARTLKLYN
jgi:predicted DNA-binding transcriptional regulator YafY